MSNAILDLTQLQKRKLANGKDIRVKHGQFEIVGGALHHEKGVIVNMKGCKRMMKAIKQKKGTTIKPSEILAHGAGFLDSLKKAAKVAVDAAIKYGPAIVDAAIKHGPAIIEAGKQAHDIFKELKGGRTGRGVKAGHVGKGIRVHAQPRGENGKFVKAGHVGSHH